MSIVETHTIAFKPLDTDSHFLWEGITRIFGSLEEDSVRQLGDFFFDIKKHRVESLSDQKISVITIRDVTSLYKEKVELELYCNALVESSKNVAASTLLLEANK